MGHRLPVILAAVVGLFAGAAAPALAAGPFADAHVAGQDAGYPDVALTPAGDALLSFTGAPGRMAGDPATGGEGVFVAARAAGTARFAAPVRVDDVHASQAQVATNDRGDAAVVYVPNLPLDPSTCGAPQACTASRTLRLVLRAAGGAFGAPQEVPLPPRLDRAQSTNEDTSLVLQQPEVVIDPDGTVTITWLEVDYAAGRQRAIAVVRDADDGFGRPHVLDAVAKSAPSLTSDGAGNVTAAWTSGPRDGFGVVVVSDRGPSSVFGAPRRLAGSDGGRWPVVVSGRRGDTVVVWESGGSLTAVRPAGGDFGPAEPLQRSGTLPTAAVNTVGDIAVSWSGPALYASLRRAGGRFDVAAETDYRGSVTANPVALDAFGRIVVLARGRDGLGAYVRSRGGSFAEPVTLRPRAEEGDAAFGLPRAGQPASAVMATDGYGNGVAAWAATVDGIRQVRAATYSATPPKVRAFAATSRTAFRFRVSEPATVRLTVRRGARRVATLRAAARAGTNRIAARGALRSRLTRRGRYVATLRAADGGPRASAPVRLRFRVAR